MNAIVIQQNEAESALAFEVHRNAAIRSVRVVRARIHGSLDNDSTEPVSIAFNFKAKGEEPASDLLRLEVAFRMTGSQANLAETAKTAILVECAFEVAYDVRPGFTITPEHVRAFKDGNAVFNVWPYYREFLQSSLQRMG